MDNPVIQVSPFPHVVIDNYLDPDTYQAIRDEVETQLNEQGYTVRRYAPNGSALIDRVLGEDLLTNIDSWFGSSSSREALLLECYRVEVDTPIPGFHNDMEKQYWLFQYNPEEKGWHEYQIMTRKDYQVFLNGQPGTTMKAYRRAFTGLFYLNDGWVPADAGQTALCTPQGEQVVRVDPVGNRLLIFQVSDESWHQPVQTNKRRDCIIFWIHEPV